MADRREVPVVSDGNPLALHPGCVRASVEQKAAMVKSLMPFLVATEPETTRDAFIRRVGERLGVSIPLLRREVQSVIAKEVRARERREREKRRARKSQPEPVAEKEGT